MTMSFENADRKHVIATQIATTHSENTARMQSAMTQAAAAVGAVARSVTPAAMLETAAQVLVGRHAIPVRLKILLDRLLQPLADEQLQQLLAALGWTRQEYMQGYLKNAEWEKCSSDEEPLILRHFLSFAETRHIALEFIQKDEREGRQLNSTREVGSFLEHMHSLLGMEAPPFATTFPMLPLTSLAKDRLSNTFACGQGVKDVDYVSPPISLSNTDPSRVSASLAFFNTIESKRRKMSVIVPTTGSNDGSLDLSLASKNACRTEEPLAVATDTRESTPASSPDVAHSPEQPPARLISDRSQARTSPMTTVRGAVSSPLDDSALNLSLSQPSELLAVTSSAPVMTHKPASPIKRKGSWDPLGSNPTALVNPVTGKKRVQCHACMKTFCDKGALKIHFSAVHLKEMHKCSVEGCTMMFSSRRSRNRHSANPNPKLHTPHMRRKISPHDGRMAQPHPSVSLAPSFNPGFAHSNLLSGLSAVPGFPLMPNPELHKQTLESLQSSLGFSRGAVNLGVIPEGLLLKQSLGHYHSSLLNSEQQASSNENNKTSRSDSNDDGSYASALNNEDDMNSLENQSGHEPTSINGRESSLTKNKRKSQQPIKFSVRMDEDDIHMSSDDSSLDDDVLDDDDDEDLKNLKSDPDSADEENTEGFIADSYSKDVINGKLDEHKEEIPENLSKRSDTKYDNKESHSYRDTDKCYPLKKLENLSNFSDFLGEGLMGATLCNESYINNNGLPMRNSESKNNLDACDNHEPSDNVCNSDDAYSGADSTFSVSPSESPNPMDERIMNGAIPINRTDPRCCVACGKTFQNLFTVKMHYQNVHMKTMHNCVIGGCKATFPSKRSRDRHSSNYNLHRKLLSTSNDQPLSGRRVESVTSLRETTWSPALLGGGPVTTSAPSAVAAAGGVGDGSSSTFYPFSLTASPKDLCQSALSLQSRTALLPSLIHRPTVGVSFTSGAADRKSDYPNHSPSHQDTSSAAVITSNGKATLANQA